MIYAPHILQAKQVLPFQEDEFGHAIPGTGGEQWVTLCRCRCDDNTTKEFKSANGEVYRPDYHVVCEMRVDIKAGTEVRCLEGDSVRGEGKVYVPKRTNFFNYTELWL